MSNKRLQALSIVLLLLSLFTELSDSQGWISFNNPELAFGLSLGFVLFSLSFNVKVIRAMGIPEKEKKQSQRLTFITAVYAFLVFGIELF
ncbi:hypothetical protein BFP97_18235 [Roseivirga sp. 4D4]|uniref:hypothetical protein n=1 Tax=Roseivirga sp. 4D4 TaxID=1889784 RepID=UPI0008538D27|nr:hypothetical protein [Roseivirga sp. 4D4]OEK03342.1 hypothetical protein BFP97_18235 [Roseivirga sp. 4D4]